MAKEIKIPQISEGVDTATVSEILVSKGDNIKEDQAVIAVETDKASTEVPSPYSGTVKEIKVSEGDEVKVGDVILTLEESDSEEKSEDKEKTKEKASEEKEEESESEDQKEKSEDKAEDKKAEKEDADESDDEGDSDEKGKGNEELEDDDESKTSKEKESDTSEQKQKDKKEDRSEQKSSKDVHASPGVRRLARELEVDIQDIEGSGESGRVTEKDVRDHKENDQKGTSRSQLELPDFNKWGNVERQALNNIKKTTAKNVTASWQSIPHVFQFGEADISQIDKYIEDHKEDVEKAGGKLTITSVLTKISAIALHKFPKFNASLDMENEEMILKKYININIAVATDEGLLVPVIRDADQKSIKELSVEISELAEKARAQKLSNEDMEGGNFSVSNLGGIGGTNFTPIVYHPQVAILGVSQASIKPVYVDNDFEPRKILPLSLSYDHRLIDGADGAEFMNWIVKALEDPYEALLG